MLTNLKAGDLVSGKKGDDGVYIKIEGDCPIALLRFRIGNHLYLRVGDKFNGLVVSTIEDGHAILSGATEEVVKNGFNLKAYFKGEEQ